MRRLDPAVKPLRQPDVEADAVEPGLGPVEIVEELVEAGDLGRLDRLVGEERRFQRPHRRGAQAQRVGYSPLDAELRRDQVEVGIAFLVGVIAETERPGNVRRQDDIAVDVAAVLLDGLVRRASRLDKDLTFVAAAPSDVDVVGAEAGTEIVALPAQDPLRLALDPALLRAAVNVESEGFAEKRPVFVSLSLRLL